MAAARSNASISGAVILALLGLGDGATAAASFSGRDLLDEAQCAAALSTAAAVPLAHTTLQLFTTLGHGSPLLAQHPQVIATLLAGVERWIGELVGRLAQPQPAQYMYAGGLPQVVVIDAIDLDLLVGLTEMLRVARRANWFLFDDSNVSKQNIRFGVRSARCVAAFVVGGLGSGCADLSRVCNISQKARSVR